jgi:DNA-binding NarL/FixJ family response regulator
VRAGASRSASSVAKMETVAKTSLLIADEMALVRDGIASLCASTGQYTIAGVCADGATALGQISRLKPDIALIDYHLPQLFSLELIRQLRTEGCSTRVIVVAGKGDRKMALEALRSGANAFMLKAADRTELLDALSRVHSGSIYVSPQLEFEKVFLAPSSRNRASDPVESLSSREYQVFQLLVDGVRAKDIAARLNLSPKTVDTYRASLMRKLDIHDVAGLVKYAIQRDLITT